MSAAPIHRQCTDDLGKCQSPRQGRKPVSKTFQSHSGRLGTRQRDGLRRLGGLREVVVDGAQHGVKLGQEGYGPVKRGEVNEHLDPAAKAWRD